MRSSQKSNLIIHFGFILTGVVTTLLAPIFPILSTRLSINDSQAGSLFTAQFVGSFLGMLCSTGLARRLGFSRTLVLGFGLMAIGVACLAIAGSPASIWSVFGFGTGLGIVIPISNLLISVSNPMRQASALNLLNFSWSIGAVVGPPLVAVQMRHAESNTALIFLALLLALMASSFLLMHVYSPIINPTDSAVSPPETWVC